MNRRNRTKARSLFEAVRVSETRTNAQINLLNLKIREFEIQQNSIMDESREAIEANEAQLPLEDIKIIATSAMHRRSNCRTSIAILQNEKLEWTVESRSVIATRILLEALIRKR